MTERVAVDELVDQGGLYAVERVKDVPQPWVSSSKRSCSTCGEDVWVDLRSTELADRLRIVCRPCLEKEFTNVTA